MTKRAVDRGPKWLTVVLAGITLTYLIGGLTMAFINIQELRAEQTEAWPSSITP